MPAAIWAWLTRVGAIEAKKPSLRVSAVSPVQACVPARVLAVRADELVDLIDQVGVARGVEADIRAAAARRPRAPPIVRIACCAPSIAR